MAVIFYYMIALLLTAFQVTVSCLKGIFGGTQDGHPYGRLYKEPLTGDTEGVKTESTDEKKAPEAVVMETEATQASELEMKTAVRKQLVLVPQKTQEERNQDVRWKKIQDKEAGKTTKGNDSSDEEVSPGDVDDTMAGVVSLPIDNATSAVTRRRTDIQRSDDNLSIIKLE